MVVRTLLLCSRPPWPLRGGDRVRTWHLARALSTIGPVGVVALRGTDEDPAAIRAGAPFVTDWWLPALRKPEAALRSAGALLEDRPLQQAIYDAPEARAAVREAIAGGVDVIVAHLVRTVPWVPDDSPPLVVDVQDALSVQYEASRGKGRGWRGLAMAVERGRIGKAEAAALARADLTAFICGRDRDAVVNGSGAPTTIAPPIVDLETFRPRDVEPDAGVIGFLGNLRSASNRDMAVHMARKILPLVRSARPEATLRIMGIEAGADVRALAKLPGVTVVGPVEDAADALARCFVTVCPLRFGSGVQNKVLESLAVGTPAVLTPEAAGAIGPRAGDAIAVGKLDRSFAMAIVELLANPQDRARRSAAGRAFVQAVHSPEAAPAEFLAAVKELAAR
ncbi:MAG: glycosyltransferase [Proteobacteria bacterium]|nr:glycosyltransferase [Pseudomonadota bacterium]